MAAHIVCSHTKGKTVHLKRRLAVLQSRLRKTHKFLRCVHRSWRNSRATHNRRAPSNNYRFYHANGHKHLDNLN